MRFAEPWFVLFLLLLWVGRGLWRLLCLIVEKVEMHFYSPHDDWVSNWDSHPPWPPPPGDPPDPIPISWAETNPPLPSSPLHLMISDTSKTESVANTNVEPPPPCDLMVARDDAVTELEREASKLVESIEYDVFDEASSFRAGEYGEARRAERRAEYSGRRLVETREKIRRLKNPKRPGDLDELVKWTHDAPGGELPVYVLMREDRWETVFGDGYYVYFSDAYLEREEADAWAALRDTAEKGTAHHVVPVAFKVPDDESSSVLKLTDLSFELSHASALTIAEALVANGEC